MLYLHDDQAFLIYFGDIFRMNGEQAGHAFIKIMYTLSLLLNIGKMP